ncbi:MAG: N-acetylglucosamine-6-phosphate deacetylase [Acidobacteria bacterium]|nr:N-acetylglucosamine-6-phosphate deacetylase [Acidobacteriota bacterium]
MIIRGKIGGTEDVVDIILIDGSVGDILPAVLSRKVDLGNETVHAAAGFIDLQLNGYIGVDFNNTETTPSQILDATKALWKTGVTSYCPTIITGSGDHINGCIENIMLAADQHPEVDEAIAGLHIEGPFISPEDGPRGAHPREHVRPPDWDEFRSWQKKADGLIRIVTLSPEWPEAIDFIDRAVDSGVIVAIGHTAATPAQIDAAVKAGARLSTHLGNGSHAKIDRHPNYIWEQLASDDLWASFIVDGHHLPPSVVKCFMRAKTTDRSILVTDAIAAAGLPSGNYKLGDVAVEVTPERKVCLPGTPYLAGSVLEMHDAIANLVRFSDASLGDALRMASYNPAALLGRTDWTGSLESGKRSDIVLFNWDEKNYSIDIQVTIVKGKVVFNKLKVES